MKNLVIAFCTLFFLQNGIAQEHDIHFEHGTLEEALALAKKNKKPLFVDVWATWCGPCKYMAATAFKDERVADFYNEKFVNLKLDGEKNDGPEVMRKYQISAYPTLLYFNAEGVLVLKIVGGQDAKTLLSKGKMVLNPEMDPVYTARKKFFASKKSSADLKSYIQVLQEEENDSLTFYAYKYVAVNPKLDLNDPLDLQVYFKTDMDYKSANSQVFLTMVNTVDADTYLSKFNDFIKVAMEAAIKKKDFSIVELAMKDLFVYVRQVKRDNLPTEADFVQRLKADYERQVGTN